MTITDALVSVTRAEYGDIPKNAIAHAKTSIRDVLGVAIYGSQHEVGERLTAYVDEMFPAETATLLGGGRTSPAGAALANGTFAHAIDFDDTFESIVLHPSAPVFSAALAAAEHDGATGRELLVGYVVGVEVAYRLGHSLYPSHYDHGWHHTGTIGSFGATAAACNVLDLSPDERRYAFGTVASGSSALKENFGSMTKPLHPGHAAQIGLRAGILARNGFTSSEHILDGEMGYGEVMSPNGEYDPEIIFEGDDEWGILDNGFKPYPSGVITHAAMEAMREVVIENDLDPGDVERVVATLDEAASEMLIHSDPENELQAKFSIEFCLAAVLRSRTPGVEEFSDDYVAAAETRSAMAKIDREFEESIFGGQFAGYGARVRVETVDGTEYVREERRAPGSPSNPVSEERLVRKFNDCVKPVLDDESRDRALDAVESLETDGALERLTTAVRGGRQRDHAVGDR